MSVSYSPNPDGTLDVIDDNGNYVGNVGGTISTDPLAFTSSPFQMAGITGVPQSTLNTGILPPDQHAGNIGSTIGSVLSSLGNVVLGGIAVSRIPPSQIGQITGPSQVAGRATGSVITSTSGLSAISSGGISGILLIGLIIIGVVLLVKHAK